MQKNLKPMAITYLSKDEIGSRLNLKYSESQDVLGKVFLGTPSNSEKFKIRIYEASPKPSTEILLDPETANSDLDDILRGMGASRDELFWIHPRAGGKLRRHVVDVLKTNLRREGALIQIVVGPRQVGKTTAVEHLIKEWPSKAHYATVDAVVEEHGPWLEKQWQRALADGENTLLVLDEIQKVENWTELVKKLWDTTKSRRIKVVLLGSTSLNHCLTTPMPESLAGRFNTIYVPHWSYAETHEAFGSDIEKYTVYGGYPKAMEYSNDRSAWHEYVGRSIINPIIDVDIYQQGNFKDIKKLRRAFRVFCKELNTDVNLTQLLNQIQHTGNTEIIKRYLEYYSDAFLLTQLPSIDENGIPDSRRSPRLMANCPAVYTFGRSSEKSISEDAVRFEQTVASELARMPHTTFGYWQESEDVGLDYFIKTSDQQIFGIHVEGKQVSRSTTKSFDRFRAIFEGARIASISPDTLPHFLKGQRSFLEMTAL